jgi:hypothetical protein
VVLYGYEAWFLTLREEDRLMVFEKRVLRRIFRSKKNDMTGGLRKLQNEELYNFHSSSSIIRIMTSKEHKMGRACSKNGDKRDIYIYIYIYSVWWESQEEKANRKTKTEVGV